MSKKIRNKINGVLLLDKPLGMSSNQAIQKIKRILNAEKIGHTGTLDPLATGLLPVCLGEATKFAGYLLDGDKEYLATAQLGVTTDSGDGEGKILTTTPVATNLLAIKAACLQLTGSQLQVPPMYSALKHNGQALYEYARAGITIERPARQITIHQLELLDYAPATQQIQFRAIVSKGTYIRTLAEDIGALLGCGASLIALRRKSSNQFSVNAASTIEELEELTKSESICSLPILACDVLTSHLSAYHLTPEEFKVLKFGNILALNEAKMELNLELRLYANGHFLGIGSFCFENESIYLRPKRLIAGTAEIQPWLST